MGTVWWFFALILVCSYTANLAAYLIVERISVPQQTTNMPAIALADTEVRTNAILYRRYGFNREVGKAARLDKGCRTANVPNLRRHILIPHCRTHMLLLKQNCHHT